MNKSLYGLAIFCGRLEPAPGVEERGGRRLGQRALGLPGPNLSKAEFNAQTHVRMPGP